MYEMRFEAAKELILEKKYNEARAILKTIDDPKARKWEAKLEELDRQRLSQSRRTRSHNPHFMRNMIVLVLGAVVFGLLALNMAGYFSPTVQHSVHLRETEVVQFAAHHATQTSSMATYEALPTATNTPKPPTLTPTPVIKVTLTNPTRYYAKETFYFRTCPKIDCPTRLKYDRGEAIKAVGIVIGDEVHGNNQWYAGKFWDGTSNLYLYAPAGSFGDTPPT